jgi:hypothetical protein
MWCDNCLLLLPLRAGAIAWASIIFVYSLAGGILLLRDGQFIYFVYPEWQIYGGISLGIGIAAALSAVALSNQSYLWTRVCKVIWIVVIIISAIRAIVMIVELQRGKDNIQWECDNGGQLWAPQTTTDTTVSTIPSGFCAAGFSSLYAAFVGSLLIDLVFQFSQMYMWFLVWRFSKRLEHYKGLKGPFGGGFYNV